MRIIFIPGIKTYNFYLNGWRKDLATQFPKAEVIFLNDEFYMWWQMEKLEKIISKALNILKDGTPTIIIAHSFGGILAKTIIGRSPKANITKLTTMASPHTMSPLGIKKIKHKLNTPMTVNVPSYTFGGYFDPIVPYRYTMLSNSKHQNLWCEHLGFLLFPWIRRKVTKEVLKN